MPPNANHSRVAVSSGEVVSRKHDASAPRLRGDLRDKRVEPLAKAGKVFVTHAPETVSDPEPAASDSLGQISATQRLAQYLSPVTSVYSPIDPT